MRVLDGFQAIIVSPRELSHQLCLIVNAHTLPKEALGIQEFLLAVEVGDQQFDDEWGSSLSDLLPI
jgi:hypothetical protein